MNEMMILTVGMFILLIISYFLSEYDFLSPSFVVTMMFTIGSILALHATAAWDISESIFSPTATWIMLTGVMIFILTEQIVKRLFIKKRRINAVYKAKPYHMTKGKQFIIFSFSAIETVIFVYAMYRKVRANGYSGGFDVSAIAKFNHALTFKDEIEEGVGRTVRILHQASEAIMLICTFTFFNNIVLCKEKFRKNIQYLIPLLAWFPNMLISSSRTQYIRVLGASVIYIYISLCRKNKWSKMKRNYIRIAKYAVMAFTAMVLLFYGAVANGLIGRKTNKTFLDYITIYIGAPIIHFHQFITSPPSDVSVFGQETFTKILPVLHRWGLIDSRYSTQMEHRRIVGIYSGNVYTFFRRPYHDFGLLGMYIIVIAIAAIFTRFYYKKIYRTNQSLRNDINLILFSYFYYIIYIFSIDNAIYIYFYFGIIYFVALTYFIFNYMYGNPLKIRFKSKRCIIARSTNH